VDLRKLFDGTYVYIEGNRVYFTDYVNRYMYVVGVNGSASLDGTIEMRTIPKIYDIDLDGGYMYVDIDPYGYTTLKYKIIPADKKPPENLNENYQVEGFVDIGNMKRAIIMTKTVYKHSDHYLLTKLVNNINEVYLNTVSEHSLTAYICKSNADEYIECVYDIGLLSKIMCNTNGAGKLYFGESSVLKYIHIPLGTVNINYIESYIAPEVVL